MIRFDAYDTGGFHGDVPAQQPIPTWRQQAAERALLHMGITFPVYDDSASTERIFPFNIIPRFVESTED